MATRSNLQSILEDILGTRNVYFQPPTSLKLKYPCIIYQRTSGDTQFSDNNPYIYTKRYQIIHIDPNPDSEIPRKIAMLPMCKHDRTYTADNLTHDVFNIYY